MKPNYRIEKLFQDMAIHTSLQDYKESAEWVYPQVSSQRACELMYAYCLPYNQNAAAMFFRAGFLK